MNQFLIESTVDLVSQRGNECFQGVVFNVFIEAPYRLDNRCPCQYPARSPHHELEEPVLGRSEVNLLFTARYPPVSWIEDQIIDTQLWWQHRRTAPGEGANSGQQFGKCEGLSQVVIDSYVEAMRHVWYCITRRQHQDWSLSLAFPQAPCHFEAVQPGEHDVQHNDVKLVIAGEFERCPAVVRNLDRVVLFLQPLLEQGGHLGFVFDY